MFPYVLSCQCSISVLTLLKIPEAYPWVYKGLLDEVLRHNAYSIFVVAFSEFATQCSTQSFHEVAYLCTTSPVFARFRKLASSEIFLHVDFLVMFVSLRSLK